MNDRLTPPPPTLVEKMQRRHEKRRIRYGHHIIVRDRMAVSQSLFGIHLPLYHPFVGFLEHTNESRQWGRIEKSAAYKKKKKRRSADRRAEVSRRYSR
jgi:hypothetical protein